MRNLLLVALTSALCSGASAAASKHVLLLAGRASHGPGEHEHRAGCLLIQQCLQTVPGIRTTVVSNGWPSDEAVFRDADAIVFFCDGGDGHPALQESRLAVLESHLAQGKGFACLHYAVEVPKERAGAQFLKWMGGYFETWWSVNPVWEADFKSLPGHPVCRGVEPFKIRDEWYYHMRFQPAMAGVQPLLSALPPSNILYRPDGPHSSNPAVRQAIERGEPQHVSWIYERPEGGRGFGFTGAHFHRNWGEPNFRKLVLNALVWLAGGEVPVQGVEATVTPQDLEKNLDAKGAARSAGRTGVSAGQADGAGVTGNDPKG